MGYNKFENAKVKLICKLSLQTSDSEFNRHSVSRLWNKNMQTGSYNGIYMYVFTLYSGSAANETHRPIAIALIKPVIQLSCQNYEAAIERLSADEITR
jgi:hypothetical protein